MLEVQGAKPLAVQRDKFNNFYFKNEEFHCRMYDNEVRDLVYFPKCDFETYMFTWKNQTLAQYLKTCIQFYGYKNPERKHVRIEDKLSVECGRCLDLDDSLNGGEQYMYLSNFTFAFFKQSWIVRYMKGVHIESSFSVDQISLDPIEEIIYPNTCVLRIMSKAYMHFKEIAEKYEETLKTSKTIHDFFKTFTKRSRFKDGVPWIPGYIHNQMRPYYKKYNIPIRPTSQSYDSVTIEDITYFDDYVFPHNEGTEKEIVIRNEIISTMRFSAADLD